MILEQKIKNLESQGKGWGTLQMNLVVYFKGNTMRIMLVILIAFLTACSSTTPYKSNKFYKEANKIFKGFNYNIVYGRTTNSYVALDVEIDKKDIKIDDLLEVNKRLIKSGWSNNYNLEGYYWSYCKPGSNDAIGIYYPNDKIKKTKNGKFFSSQLNYNTVYIWMTNYKSDEMNFEHTECP